MELEETEITEDLAPEAWPYRNNAYLRSLSINLTRRCRLDMGIRMERVSSITMDFEVEGAFEGIDYEINYNFFN